MDRNIEALVSVIIPTHNRKHTIKRAIDSVLNQTYRNVEVIIVDDCSTDDTFNYVADLYGELDNIIYIKNDNNIGAGASRNVGVVAANGEYIAFQDSDDEWHPLKLEKQMQAAMQAEEEAGLIYSAFRWKWDDGTTNEWPPAGWAWEMKTGNVFPGILISPLVGMITILMKKSIFVEAGGFREDLSSLEDYEFTIRIARKYPFLLVDEVLATAYESMQSVGKRNDDKIMTQCDIMSRYAAALEQYGLKKMKFLSVLGEAKEYQAESLYLRTLLEGGTEYLPYIREYMDSHTLASPKQTVTENIAKVEDCTGCMSCYQSCPYGAITQGYDEEGFVRPVVDQSKCQKCQRCIAACPVCSSPQGNALSDKGYAVIADDILRSESSSGGVFPYLATRFLEQGGAVVGAAFDEKYDVRHIVITCKEELKKLQSSKYVQSHIGTVYQEVETLLKKQVKVLFTGCACQVAGLKAYLKLPYEHLFTVEVVCHGVPSAGIFSKYMKEASEGQIENIQEVSFRKKDKMGWSSGLYIRQQGKEELLEADNNPYMYAFLKNWSLRESCYECQWKGKSCSDLTLGDFWGINKLADFDDGKGTSLVIPNTDKGISLLNQIAPKVKKIASVPTQYAVLYNPCINQSVHRTKGRKLFFEAIQKESFREATQAVLSGMQREVALVLMWSRNYGNALTNYALYQTVKKLGRSVIALDNFCPLRPVEQFERFARTHYECSSDLFGDYDRDLVNRCCESFLVGSDQVWNYKYEQFYHYGYYFQLDFVSDTRRKVAYAASFGEKSGALSKEAGEKLYQRFDAISVREESGAEICREYYQKEARVVPDPVFLLSKEEYGELAKASDVEEKEPYILAYLLNPTSYKRQLCKNLSKALGMKIISIIDANPVNRLRNMAVLEYDNIKADLQVEDFVSYLMNSAYIVTDSYHGTCFSVIFNKPFVAVLNRETDRFRRFEQYPGLKGRMIEDKEEYHLEDFIQKIDFNGVNDKIRQQVSCAKKWLEENL